MLITHFNKLIRNRFLWLLLALIICFAFVGVEVLSHLHDGSLQSRSGEGSILGKEVTPFEFRMARYFELGMRSDANLSPEENKILRRRTWERIAALEAAKQLQISASEDELVATLKNEPTFQVNGLFSKDRFRYVLSQINTTEQLYTQYLEQEIVLQKLMNIIQSSIWIPPSETQLRAAGLMDYFTVEYVNITEPVEDIKVEVSDNEAITFYTENKHLFEVPEMLRVKYAAFTADSHINNTVATDAEIERFYYENIDDYISLDTNNNTVTTPLPDVNGLISEKLRQKKALRSAADIAADFVMAMTPTRSTPGLSMEQAAEKFNTILHISDLFTINESVHGIDAGLEFNRIAFSLDHEDPERSFSDAITGSNNIYVVAFNERIASYIPAFEDIKQDVLPYAESELRKKLADKRISDIRNSIAAKMSSGSSFTEASRGLQLNVFTTETFTVYGGMLSNQFEHSSLILPKVMSLSENDITEPVKTSDGVIIASVTERLPGDAFSIQTIKPQIIATMERFKTSLVFEDWLAANLANADFIDNLREFENTGNEERDAENEY